MNRPIAALPALLLRRSSAPIAALALALVVPFASAQDYPSKPVRIIVPFAAGGPADVYARFIAQRLQESLGQTFIVDDRPGAGSIIGTDAVAKSAPDGYTLLVVHNAIAIKQTLYPKLPYDTVRDFAPIGTVAGGPYLMVIPVSVPAQNATQFIAWVKSKPGQVSYASAGAGSPTHLAGELFRVAAGNLDMQHIPYKGGGALMPDLLAGRVSAFFSSITTAQVHVNAGKLRPIAVTTTKRSPQVPETPTFAEAGYPDVVVNAWYGMLTTGGTPKARVERLGAALQQVLADPQMREQIQKQGLNAEPSTPEEFAKLIRTEMVKWAKVVKAAGIQPE